MSVRLFVGNLPYEATEAELRQHFSAIGPLASIFLPVDRESGRPRGFAFVEFADPALATTAIQRLNNQPFKGRPLSVSEARARETGGGGRPMGGPPMGAPRGDRPPRPMGPSYAPGAPPGPPAEGRQRNFGPDAPRKGRGKPKGPRRDEGPKGPIPIKSGGRVYAVDDLDDDVTAEVESFDDIASSLPDADDEPEKD